MNKLIALVFLVLTILVSYGQAELSGDFLMHMDGVINSLPGSSGNQYKYPDASQSTIWKEVIAAVVDKDYEAAATKASQLDYELIKFTDNSDSESKEYYILQMTSASTHYWGTYVFNPDPCRSQLVIQAPHPVLDINTGKQGAYVFRKTNALAFFVSGTHRCNSTTFSSCSGTTSVCGSSQAYRISDVAHNVAGPFHMATDVMNSKLTFGVFIQLHGFNKDPGDPSAIFSNGTRITPSPDYIASLQEELASLDPTLTFKAAHLNFDWDKLLAFTNTQGRLINLSVQACSTNSTSTKGKFIHIEQEYDKLRSSKQKWDLMVKAIEVVFSCGVVTGLNETELDREVLVYPNPFTDKLTIIQSKVTGDMTLEIFSMHGQRMIQRLIIKDETTILPELDEGTYVYMLRVNSQLVEQGKIIKLSNN